MKKKPHPKTADVPASTEFAVGDACLHNGGLCIVAKKITTEELGRRYLLDFVSDWGDHGGSGCWFNEDTLCPVVRAEDRLLVAKYRLKRRVQSDANRLAQLKADLAAVDRALEIVRTGSDVLPATDEEADGREES